MKILTPKPVSGNKFHNLISELILRTDRLLEHVRKIDEILGNHSISKVESDITPSENSVTCDISDSSKSSYVTESSFSPKQEEIFIENPPR